MPYALFIMIKSKKFSPRLINKLNTSSISIKNYGFIYDVCLP